MGVSWGRALVLMPIEGYAVVEGDCGPCPAGADCQSRQAR
jgi:hypothetical protein